jgi:hypothetical protein
MILYFNIKKDLERQLDSITKLKGKDVECVVMNWIPTNKKDASIASSLLKQTDILEKFIKTVPIVIFDEQMKITKDEYTWLKKFKTFLFQPSILHRDGFTYLPNWTTIKKLSDLKLNTSERNVHLGYIGDLTDKTKQFDKYFVSTKILNDVKFNVSYKSSLKIPDENYTEYKRINILLNQNLSFSDIEYTVILGTKIDYNIGCLNASYFNALENNCVPFVPNENRFYHALPYRTDDKTNWFDFYKNMYNTTYIGMLLDIYDNIKKYYPEMDVKYTADKIKGCIEK